jgi:hypothetical protein
MARMMTYQHRHVDKTLGSNSLPLNSIKYKFIKAVQLLNIKRPKSLVYDDDDDVISG